MSILMALLLATASWSPAALAPQQGGSVPSRPPTEQVTIHKDGGPGHGPDQPYSIREQGATDLERFVGGKQVIFVAPYDLFVVLAIVVLVVVLVILL